MRKYKKIISIFCFALVLLSINTLNVWGGNDNIAFSFQVYAWQNNNRDPNYRYRETKNTKNMWKVNLKHTEEGSGDGNGNITTFWMSKGAVKKDATQVTDDINAAQGHGNYYDVVRSTANQSNVYLSAENNNFSGWPYYISGTWDEETGVLN